MRAAIMNMDIQQHLASTLFAFRGYDLTNLGRTPELLAHPKYGPVVADALTRAGQVTSEETGKPTDLVDRVRRQEETTLDSFADAVALIMAAEIAQIDILREFHGIDFARGQLAAGYSLGEIAAGVCCGLFTLEDALRVPVSLAGICAELGRDVSMGVLFSLGAALDLDVVNHLCIEINCRQQGVMGISSYLSPNTVLLLGQQNTIDTFREEMKARLPKYVHMRKNEHHWPPLHTPILWQACVPNRAAMTMHELPGGFGKPAPPILSMVTGKASYNEYNAREILHRWVDHPQRVWDVVYESLQAGIELVVHVGPAPNLLPATYKRLSENVQAQVNTRSASGLGLRFVSGMARRRWLTALLPSRTGLLRAPYLQHVILEDWLLGQ
jgi:[acyl-carrier-protein] S-malonyltransferase